MQPTTYQQPELRDANDQIIRSGTFGKNTALSNSTNDGWIDYVMNNLEYLYNNCLPLSGGTMAGFIKMNGLGILGTSDAGYNTFHGGAASNGSGGAYMQVYGKNHDTSPGEFRMVAMKTNGSPMMLRGKPDGTLKWGDNNVVTDDQLLNYAPKASPAFLGTPTAPTATHGTANTQLATTQFVSTAIGRSGKNQIDTVTTGGNYTVPETGLYKITLKGGGAGGSSGGYYGTATSIGGNGGGEGGTQIVYRILTKDTVIPVVIGAGGAGGVASQTSGGASRLYGGNGGNTSVTINGNTITANGGKNTGLGGTGMIPGAPGERYIMIPGTLDAIGGSGGGNGGGSGTTGNSPGTNGGGGCGGHGQASTSTVSDGAAGGAGYVWFEYHKAAYD